MESVKKIRNTLGIGTEAVGVKYTDETPATKPSDGQYAVCNGLLEAAGGKVIMLTEETCSCPGGRSSLGLSGTRSASM